MGKITVKHVNVGMLGTNCYIAYDKNTKEGFIVDPGADASVIINAANEAGAAIKAILLTHGHFDHIGAADECAGYFKAHIYASEDEKEMLEDISLNVGEMFRINAVAHADKFVKDNQTLNIAGFEIKAIATPGHTKGGVCYYIESEQLIFSGDTLFFEGYGRYDFPTANSTALFNSINKKLFVLEDEITVLSGHGRMTTIGYEKKNNPCVHEL